MSKEQFFTRAKANAGAKMMLTDPFGNATDDWFIVRGLDSDEYRSAQAEERDANLAAAIAKMSGKQYVKPVSTSIVALVASWSFEGPCTAEAVADFLKEAPHIADDIQAFAMDISNFLGPNPASSKTGLQSNSSLEKNLVQEAAKV
jgi:hypothetical protein